MSRSVAVAVVGAGAVLPGAASPEALWRAVRTGRDLLTPTPAGLWPVDPAATPRRDGSVGGPWRGGYVDGFERGFDPEGLVLDGDPALLDRSMTWLLDALRQAVRGAGRDSLKGVRAALVLGNLAYPTRALVELGYAASAGRAFGVPAPQGDAWLARFAAGRPAFVAARAIGIEGPAFAIDAACASSLYAVKLACDKLADGEADIAIAAALNGCDPIFLHRGFDAIRALSLSGRSRPFHAEADGLIPAEGAAALALKRLDDALRDGDRILTVIRGVGLSNDGRRGGLLAPDAGGQARAMRAAYAACGVDPATVSLIECHATGTPAGDRTEVASLKAAFPTASGLPVGSLKSNLGHLITVAGMAAIIKMIGAMADRMRPPTLHVDQPLPELADGRLRLIEAAEPWEAEGPLRAGVNNFGFGGANAHLILEEPPAPGRAAASAPAPASAPAGDVVLCGVGVVFGPVRDLAGVPAALDGVGPALRAETARAPMRGLAFFPNDLHDSLGQQSLAFDAGLRAAAAAADVDPERAGVVVGMGVDMDAARMGLRWRAERDWRAAAARGKAPDGIELDALLDAIGGLDGPAGVIGPMPNVPANRLNVQLGLLGPGFTVAAEELSGAVALSLGARALRAGEVDMMLCGAVDLSDEPMHRAACAAIPALAGRRHADAAILFVLKRRADAERAGDAILAAISAEPMDFAAAAAPGGAVAHAADAAVKVAVAVAEGCDQLVEATAFTGWRQRLRVRPVPAAVASSAPLLLLASAADAASLADALEAPGGRLDAGPWRAAIVAPDADALQARAGAAAGALRAGRTPAGPGVHVRAAPLGGRIAFAFPGMGGARAGDGAQAVAAFPEIVARLRDGFGAEGVDRGLDLIAGRRAIDGLAALSLATTTQSNLSALIARHALGLSPDAYLGVSMGESNMLAAHGLWPRPDRILSALESSGFFTLLGGDAPLAAEALGVPGAAAPWRNFDVYGAADATLAAIAARRAAGAQVWATIVYSDRHVQIGGLAQDCAAILARIAATHRAAEQPFNLAFHGPFAAAFEARFRAAHERALTPRPPADFYFNASDPRGPADPAEAPRLLARGGVEMIDFRPTVRQAWDDGVRIFVDVGPRQAAGRAIETTLAGREHLVVALGLGGRAPMVRFAEAAAALFAAGAPVPVDGVLRRLARLRPGDGDAGSAQGPVLTIAAHLPAMTGPAAVVAEAGAAPLRGPAAPPCASRGARAPHRRWTALRTHRKAGDAAAASTTVMVPPAPGRAARLIGLTAADAPRDGAALRRAAAPPPNQPEDSMLRSTTAGRSDGDPSPRAAGPAAAPVASLRSQYAAAAAPPAPIPRRPPTGPTLDRAALEFASRDRLSVVFGPLFERQDGYRLQCRMPEPPLLLVDRVTGVEGEPGSMGKGVCWTETDVVADAWYLDDGRMPTGLLIEAGQADLLLISWLGVDFLNRDARAYRLLGCELTFHRSVQPRVGDTLRYQIHIDGHAEVGGVRLFFFRYDAHVGDRLLSSVRSGQAGFFSAEELAGSDGVLWSAEEDAPKAGARLDPAPCITAARAFDDAAVAAFADGDALGCFGAGFERAAAHTSTPRIPSGRMRLIDRVTCFEPQGGPWGRGYLRAEFDAPQDAWFYDGHFHNDPCMPGTLMAEAATQALRLHFAALGFTLERDGWRFGPAVGEPFKFVCRGQVIPDGPHRIEYEVFVEEIVDGDEPTIYAALLARRDGFKVFLCRRFGVTLHRDWPMEADRRTAPARIVSPARADGGPCDVPGDAHALAASALGKPSEAFGAMMARFDAQGRALRLPAPPYNAMSRVVSVDCPAGTPTAGGALRSAYDIPADAWWAADGGAGVMPFAVLTEVMLQPCGWFATYMGFAADREVALRNLDGDDVRVHAEVTPDLGTLTIDARFDKHAAAGASVIVFYTVALRAGDRLIATLRTSFGLFDPAALATQRGLPASQAERAEIARCAEAAPLPGSAAMLLAATAPRLPGGRLRMVDDIVAHDPAGGPQGLGRMVGRQSIDPRAWYFKAHFFTDPVQPGSLGLEALFTLLKTLARRQGLADGLASPRFEAPAVGSVASWRYRGQVTPRTRVVVTEVAIASVMREADGSVLVVGEGALHADGLKIYAVKGFALRIRAGAAAGPAARLRPAHAITAHVDLVRQPWLADHALNRATPVLPGMAVVEMLLAAQGAGAPARIARLDLGRFVRLDRGPVTVAAVAADPTSDRLVLLADDAIIGAAQCGGAAAPQTFAEPPPGALAPCDPYRDGALFVQARFRAGRNFRRGAWGCVHDVDVDYARRAAGGGAVVLLDAMLQGFAWAAPHLSLPDAPRDWLGAPWRIEDFTLHGALPLDGALRVATRLLPGAEPRQAQLSVVVRRGAALIADFRVVVALAAVPLLTAPPPAVRGDFAAGLWFAAGVAASALGPDGAATCDPARLRAVDWVPGTVDAIYRLRPGMTEAARAEAVASKDCLAAAWGLHPGLVRLDPDGFRAPSRDLAPPASVAVRWIDGRCEARLTDTGLRGAAIPQGAASRAFMEG